MVSLAHSLLYFLPTEKVTVGLLTTSRSVPITKVKVEQSLLAPEWLQNELSFNSYSNPNSCGEKPNSFSLATRDAMLTSLRTCSMAFRTSVKASLIPQACSSTHSSQER